MIKQRLVNEVDYNEIEKLVHDNFGHGVGDYRGAYSFIATEECGNDCSISIPCVSSEPGEDDDIYTDDIAKFFEDGTPGDMPNYVIMGLLCQRGLIPPGDYLVEVCW